jgi:hypothetical protein
MAVTAVLRVAPPARSSGGSEENTAALNPNWELAPNALPSSPTWWESASIFC